MAAFNLNNQEMEEKTSFPYVGEDDLIKLKYIDRKGKEHRTKGIVTKKKNRYLMLDVAGIGRLKIEKRSIKELFRIVNGNEDTQFYRGK